MFIALRPLLGWLSGALADLLRGAVRCAVPLVMLTVFSVLLFVAQGRDAMLVLVERAAREGADHSISGLVFLGVGGTALSLSLWYSMRWLLTARMASLPLGGEPGWLRSWLPRAIGFAVPGLIALDLHFFVVPNGLPDPVQATATTWAQRFVVLGLILVVFYWLRGGLMEWLQARGWLAEIRGRKGSRPDEIDEDERLPAVTQLIIGWSVVLSALVALVIILFPQSMPRVIGPAGVAALGLASMNLVGSFLFSYWPLRNRLPHLAPWAILFAGLIGGLNDNHVVRPAGTGADVPYQRIAVAADFEAFLDGLAPDGTSPVPVVLIASEGGGIRAAYWTAAVLEALRRRVPELERHLYAMSGASGGSVGMAGWLVSQRSRLCSIPQEANTPSATDALGMDYVAPAVAGMLYGDMMQRFIPWPIAPFDRSRALEEGWQRAFAHAAGRPFEAPLAALYRGCERLPHLMLNSTVVETGERAVLTLLETNPDGGEAVLIDHFDAMDEKYTAWRQSLAGLAHHSARFPVISPAGTIQEIDADGERSSAFRLVDGGYFDNSGIQSLMELIGYLRSTTDRDFEPILILLRNSPDENPSCNGPCTPGTGDLFPELASIVIALYQARGAHAELSLQSVDRFIDDKQRFDLVVGEKTPASRAPLGWSLSASVRKTLDDEAEAVAERVSEDLSRRLGSPTQEAGQ
jgi:hypothetical protein